MVKKLLLHTALLAAAVGAPVAYFTGSDYWKGTGDQGTSAGATNDAKASGQAASLDASLSGVPVGEGSPISVEGTPVRDLAEVFRFDVTTDWILRHWPRVSTGLAQLQLQGYRVPLVTGTGEADLAGSLTYYFNARQKVQRITFCGTTGDARQLVALLTSRHQFTRRLTNSPGLFVYEVVSPAGRPQGVLKIQSAQIVKASEPYRRFDVDLIIERPS